MNSIKYILYGICLWCSIVTNIQALTAAEDLTTRLQQFSSLTADFKQHNAQHGESKGNLILQKPLSFVWNIVAPEPLKIVCNGTTMWHYDELLEQVIVTKVQQEFKDLPLVFLLSKNMAQLSTEFTITFAADADSFILIPTTPSNHYQKIEIKFINNKLSALYILDNFEQTTEIVFNQVILNKNLDPQNFEFAISDNIDVIGDI